MLDPFVLVTVADHPLYSRPLAAQQEVNLVLRGVPASQIITLSDAQTGNIIATGESNDTGVVLFAATTIPAAGNVAVRAPTIGWAAQIEAAPYAGPDIAPSPDVSNLPIVSTSGASSRASSGGAAVGTGGGSSGGGCCSPSPTATLLGCTQAANYGHWHANFCWYRIDSESDVSNRYYITTSTWFGGGYSDSNPWHLETDVYHAALGRRLDGNTFMVNYNPVAASADSYQSSYTIGYPPSATIGWTQTDPAWISSTDQAGTDPTWDQDTYYPIATFSNNQYQGSLEYGAMGEVPTGHYGYMYVEMIHKSQPHSCGGSWPCTTYTDDTGWYNRMIDWS